VALLSEAATTLGFNPRYRLDGLIDQRISDSIGFQLLAVLREALSNVVRHAGASTTSVEVTVTDTDLVVTVIDDGTGAGTGERLGGQGLASLRHRAEALGGTLEVGAGAEGTGTTVCWQVPLRTEGS